MGQVGHADGDFGTVTSLTGLLPYKVSAKTHLSLHTASHLRGGYQDDPCTYKSDQHRINTC